MNTNYNIGDVVYLITDPDQIARIILSIQLLPSNGLLYLLGKGEESSWHYELELSKEKVLLNS